MLAVEAVFPAEPRFLRIRPQPDAVIKLINAIGTVSENSGSAISAARSGYDALTDTQKKLVTNYNKLTQAEQVFSSLPSVGDKLPFTDMNGHWAYDAVSYAYKNSLMNGVNASRFRHRTAP